jgi:CBS domain-containing protein
MADHDCAVRSLLSIGSLGASLKTTNSYTIEIHIISDPPMIGSADQRRERPSLSRTDDVFQGLQEGAGTPGLARNQGAKDHVCLIWERETQLIAAQGAPFKDVAASIPEESVMKVRSVMHKGVEWVSPDTPISVIATKMRQLDIGAIPIGENDRLIGMVTDRDIAVKAIPDGKDISKLTARDVMSQGVIWCRDSDDVKEAAQIMGRKQIRRLPVIDSNKRMIGMLSLGDVSHATPQRVAAEVTKAVSDHHAST